MTYEQKIKLKDLRCKAWGITEDEYYCNQCSDFSLEDMARAYRRGKNKGARMYEVSLRDKIFLGELLKEQTETTIKIDKQLTKAKELLKEFVHHYKAKTIYIENMKALLEQAEQFLSEVEKC